MSHLKKDEDLVTAVKGAMQNPLLDNIDLSQALAAIVSVVAKDTIELSQYNQIGATVHQQLPHDALVIIGLTVDANLESELEVMVIATGIATKLLEEDLSASLQSEDNYINVHDFLKHPSALNQGLKPELKSELTQKPSQHHHDVNDLQIPTYLRYQKQPH